MERLLAGSMAKDKEIFQCLRDEKTPRSTLGVSVGLHCVALSVLLLVPLLTPHNLNLSYRTVILAPLTDLPDPPEPEPLKLVPLRTPPAPVAPPRDEPVLAALPAPLPEPAPPKPEVRVAEVKPKTIAIEPPSPPRLALTPTTPLMAAPKPEPIPVPVPPVITNVFATTAASQPVAAAPARNAETAGFGDVQGPRETGRRGIVGGTGTLSGFDAGAPGGVPGGVRSGTGRGTVMSSGFSAPAEMPKAAASQPRPAESKIDKPVEILFKPRPDYTDDARKMRIEGEVLLRVLFTSTGELRVLEVIRGLGHGLNENAIKAAEQIRFKPAQRANQPADSTAVVHIVFQLAY